MFCVMLSVALVLSWFCLTKELVPSGNVILLIARLSAGLDENVRLGK